MTEAIDAAVTTLTSALEAGIKAVGTLGEKYGPEIVDAALTVVRLKGAEDLVVGFSAAAIAFFSIKHGARLLARGKELSDIWSRPSTPSSAPDGTIQCVGGGLAVALGGIACVVSFLMLSNIWNYVAIFEPKLWVARRLLGL